MSMRALLLTARRWSLLLVAATLVGGLASVQAVSSAPSQYETRVGLLVGPLNGRTDALRASGLLTQTYAAVLTTDDALRTAALAAGLPEDTDVRELATKVSVLGNDRTRVLSIGVVLPDAQQSLAMATSLLGQLSARSEADTAAARSASAAGRAAEVAAFPDRVLGPPADPGAEGALTVVDPPRLAAEPVPRPTLLFGLLGAVAGAALVLALVLLATSRTRRRPVRLERWLEERLLGTCRLDSSWRRRLGVVTEARPQSAFAVDYRVMAGRAELLAPDGRLEALLVVGTASVHGSGEVAANLAVALAQPGREVGLVDLAGGTPATVRFLGKKGTNRRLLKAGDAILHAFVRDVPGGRVTVIGEEDPVLHSADRHRPDLLELVRNEVDVAVVHGPPLLLDGAGADLASHVDMVVVVAGESETDDEALRLAEALDALERRGGVMVRLVVTTGGPSGSMAGTRAVPKEPDPPAPVSLPRAGRPRQRGSFGPSAVAPSSGSR